MTNTIFSRVEREYAEGNKYYLYELNYTSDMSSGMMSINLLIRNHSKDAGSISEVKMICDWLQEEIKMTYSLINKLDLYSLYDVLYYGYKCPQSELNDLCQTISSYKRAFVHELLVKMK